MTKAANLQVTHGTAELQPGVKMHYVEAGAGYLPTGSRHVTGSEHGRSRCDEGLRGLMKADSLVA